MENYAIFLQLLITFSFKFNYPPHQCCGSVTFWYGSGSADLNLWFTDSDPTSDPAIFFSDLQDGNQKFCFLLFEATFASFFNPYLVLMDPDPGGPKTYGYGYGSGSATLPPLDPFPPVLWICMFLDLPDRSGFWIHLFVSGSESFHHQTKLIRKNFIPTVLLFCDILKGLSHEIDFKNVDKKLHNLA